MATTLLVTLQGPQDADTVREIGAEILAEYPDSLLVRATDDQVDRLDQRGIEVTPLSEQPVQITGSSFVFEDAVRAQEVFAVDPRAGRTAYYLVKLVGPPAPEWLLALRGLGTEIHGNLPGYTLLVGMLPERVEELRAASWVVALTPYRPTMKVAAPLRSGMRRNLEVEDLSALAVDDAGGDAQLVEVSVFPGESVNEVAGLVRRAGGTVVSTLPHSFVATARPATITELAELQGIQAILPHSLPELHNDRATSVMRVPTDHVFDGLALRGTGQVVAVADSGLDTGVAATVHPDVRGRVAGLVSWPTRTSLGPLINDPPGRDNGAADRESGHGTHVTGSVLGSGAAARTAGAGPVPAGTAPEARVFFQAIEQEVDWKSAAQLVAEGELPPTPPWPPAASGLWGLPDDLTALFQQAYDAGARIHTNSWGSRQAGEYTANSRAVDQFMWDNPDMLILFSAGNEGADVDRDGVIDADSVGPPGTAKNCLTVGASENDRPAGSDPPPGRDLRWDQWGTPRRWPELGAAGHVSDDVDGLAAFSSRGPTDDGRTKPDVVAPGTNVLSMMSSVVPAGREPLWGRLLAGHPLRAAYCWSGGTSMSTPLVAGAAALVRQHLVEQRAHLRPGRQPSGALLKAVLVNGAVAMAGQFAGEVPEGTNPAAGFGRIDVTAAIAPEPLRRMLFADDPDDAVSTGQMRVHRVQGVDPAAPLKVTLAWTDAPAPPGIGQLVNRLYLQVRTPDGRVVDGDVTPFDTVTNNVQQVVIDAPVAGEYLVRVRGVSVIRRAPGAGPSPNPRQDYAVVVSNGADMT